MSTEWYSPVTLFSIAWKNNDIVYIRDLFTSAFALGCSYTKTSQEVSISFLFVNCYMQELGFLGLCLLRSILDREVSNL